MTYAITELDGCLITDHADALASKHTKSAISLTHLRMHFPLIFYEYFAPIFTEFNAYMCRCVASS